ncbi:MAG: hypothetical protein GY804_04075 [Alphaproteobacteria bacterium]|nr:hypothetical protein [Alphaproteobacteria bacterium]
MGGRRLMRFDGKENRQKISNMSISKLSVCAKPAHSDALATIIKSAKVTPRELEKQTFVEALSQSQVEEEACKIYSISWDLFNALENSMRVTISDSLILNKKEIIQTNIADFANALHGVIGATDIIKEADMTQEEMKKMVDDAVAPVQKALDKANALAKMNDDMKSFYGDLDEAGKENFLKMDDTERVADIEKSRVSDEVFKMGDTEIKKSVVGADVFEIMKAQQAQINDGIKKTKEAIAKSEMMEFTKTAETLYPNLPGKPEDKGAVLKTMSTMNAGEKATLETMLKSANDANEGLFKEVGSTGDPEIKTSEEKLDALAKKYAEDNKVTFAKAYTAVLDTPEGRKSYNEYNKK